MNPSAAVLLILGFILDFRWRFGSNRSGAPSYNTVIATSPMNTWL